MDSISSAESIQEPVTSVDCYDGNKKFEDTEEPPKINMVTETSAEKGEMSESAPESPAKEVEESLSHNDNSYLHLEPEIIIGAAFKGEEFLYLFRWKDSEREDLVPSSIASVKWPEYILEYYEASLAPHDEEDSSSSYDEDNSSGEEETIME